MSSHSITRQESHTVRPALRYLFSVYQKQCLGREGRPVQSKQGAGKRQRGTGPGGKGFQTRTGL